MGLDIAFFGQGGNGLDGNCIREGVGVKSIIILRYPEMIELKELLA